MWIHCTFKRRKWSRMSARFVNPAFPRIPFGSPKGGIWEMHDSHTVRSSRSLCVFHFCSMTAQIHVDALHFYTMQMEPNERMTENFRIPPFWDPPPKLFGPNSWGGGPRKAEFRIFGQTGLGRTPPHSAPFRSIKDVSRTEIRPADQL